MAHPPPPPIVDADPDTAVIKAELWTEHDAVARAVPVVHVVQASPAVAPMPVQAVPVSDPASASAASVSYDPTAHDTHVTPDSRDAPVVEAAPVEEPKPEEKPAETPAETDTTHAAENISHTDDPNSGHDTPTDQNSDHG